VGAFDGGKNPSPLFFSKLQSDLFFPFDKLLNIPVSDADAVILFFFLLVLLSSLFYVLSFSYMLLLRTSWFDSAFCLFALFPTFYLRFLSVRL
jgi:hypothetical protein